MHMDAASEVKSLASLGEGRDRASGGRYREPEPLLLQLGGVAPAATGWLWPRRVPLGRVTLLVGDPGLGKSLLTLDVAARVSRGLAWPDGSGAAVAGRVILLNGEDGVADTIRPRLDALGADADRVEVLRAVMSHVVGGEVPFSLTSHLAALETAVRQWPDTRLVVLDPLSAFLGTAHACDGARVRRLLGSLQLLAERTGVALVGVNHLSKRTQVSMMYRAGGTMAFVAVARSVWAVVPDPAVKERVLLLPVKCNLARRPAGLAYRVVPSPGAPEHPVVEWEPEPVETSLAEAMESGLALRQRRLDAAMVWLEDALANGPQPCQEVERRAREAGLAIVTLRRAKRALGVVAQRQGCGYTWLWRLPEDVSPARAVGAATPIREEAAAVVA